MKKHTVRHGDIVKREDRTIVVLRVSKRDIRNGLNAERAGLYGFQGLWHGDDFSSHRSYGKIENKKSGVIVGNIFDDKIKSMTKNEFLQAYQV